MAFTASGRNNSLDGAVILTIHYGQFGQLASSSGCDRGCMENIMCESETQILIFQNIMAKLVMIFHIIITDVMFSSWLLKVIIFGIISDISDCFCVMKRFILCMIIFRSGRRACVAGRCDVALWFAHTSCH